ncbi:MAG: discoidin domain-containing protein [Verrucomicrobiota bacterium]
MKFSASLIALWTAGLLHGHEPFTSEQWRQLLEAEWLKEAQTLTEAWSPAKLSTTDDAAGGCDGVTNGRWGFHTRVEKDPWWQVDLGKVEPIKDVRLWNRADSEEVARRAAHFRILFSEDGVDWRQVYEHNGSVFYGYRMPDRWPLTVPLTNGSARFVRIQLPGETALHLDEVEVHGSREHAGNLALKKAADQSSISQWSEPHPRSDREPAWRELTLRVLANGERWLQEQRAAERPTAPPRDASSQRLGHQAELVRLQQKLDALPPESSARSLYLEARLWQRRFMFENPLLDFDAVLFTKRVPGSYSHMSDQYYGWWSRPGGGIYILRGFKSGPPTTECVTDAHFKEPGSFLRPELSYDGKKILFAWCKHYPELAGEKNKLNKANVPEDAFYHLFEMDLDGSAPRRLTRGKYDNFDGRYLPNGRIVFLSTRRGQSIQVGKRSAQDTLARGDLPDCYVRCGGDESRPVAVYTLHTMNADGSDLIAISPFEMFEWEPSVANDGAILYSRWDYVDRDNMPYMSLWAINPDGTNARLVYGNYSQAPHCTFEPRAIPCSHKMIFTASGHHSQTMGSLVLLDPTKGSEGPAPIQRLTPQTPFPEIEAWPHGYFANPWPLSEETLLVSWGVEAETREGRQRPRNGMGIHLFSTAGGLELLYRDPDISSMYPIPLKARPKPPTLASAIEWDGPQEGCFLVADVTRGLKTVQPGEVKALRVVALPAKTQPRMNEPMMGVTRDDPGKAVLGTVPVEPDGSAYFRAPAGVALFFQALDNEGRAIQTMRSATHVQPGQTLSCTGCHESRHETPPARSPLASKRPPSKIAPGPEGSWPLRFDRLIQPVLDAQCVSCHQPNSGNAVAAKFDLTPARSYQSLTRYGNPSLRDLVLAAYREGVSTERRNPALLSPLLALLKAPGGHYGVRFDAGMRDRFVTWLDTYGQRAGAFSEQQEEQLESLRAASAALFRSDIAEDAGKKP